MGCSSSALNKAGDGSRLRSEESESCLAQPKPHTLGKESSALHGKVQKESPPPVEKLKISAVSRANGVKSLWEQPLANDAADPPGPTADTQPLEGPEESGPLQPGGKDDTPGAEEKNDIEAMTEAQSLKGNAETESLGRDTKYEPLQITGERDSPGAVDATETPQTAREMSPIRTAEKVPPQEAVGEPQPQEAMGKAEQTQLPETAPKEIERPETLEGGHVVEMAEERQLQETLGKDEHSQLLETVPRENETPEVLEESQFAETAGNNDLLHKAPEGLGNMEQIQPEGIVGSVEHPAGILETGANMEMVIHTNEEDQHIEGETGEKVETEMENENVSDGAGTKEEETGEAVDLSAAL
ncbi:glutamate-rich protein 5 [Crocuta crocuta]